MIKFDFITIACIAKDNPDVVEDDNFFDIHMRYKYPVSWYINGSNGLIKDMGQLDPNINPNIRWISDHDVVLKVRNDSVW